MNGFECFFIVFEIIQSTTPDKWLVLVSIFGYSRQKDVLLLLYLQFLAFLENQYVELFDYPNGNTLLEIYH